MAYRRELDDSCWDEVTLINSYALFMGYLSMAIKGLGFLVLTWTTVVLLGGFVSVLQKKDFWCLTFITFVQTAGIFDVYQNEKLSHIADSVHAMMAGVIFGVFNDHKYALCSLSYLARFFIALVTLVVQILVLAILVCPLAAIYVFGLLISTGLSIWRLIQHDYGGNSDGESNLKPAMDTLYYLALLQGVLFCYRFLFSLKRKAFATQAVAEKGNDEEREVLLTYLREIRIGCEKDPSFARGRNLITHAVDLIGSKSRDECPSGVKMLYTAICMGEKRPKKARAKGEKEYCFALWHEFIGQQMMMKNLIISASSSHVLQKLLHTLDPRGAFDRETRNQGATIVAHLALDIQLEQFPGAIQYISTLIDSFEEYCLIEPYHRDRLLHKHDQDWDRQASRVPSAGDDFGNLREAYEKLVLTGLCILWKLATHENNCRIISQTQGLLPRIMAPVTSDMFHEFDSGAWSKRMVEESLKVMFQLVAAPGETGAMLRQEISSNKGAISTMERILNCPNCTIDHQKWAMGILMRLYMDIKSSETYINMLVDIFADDTKERSIRKLAGKVLAKLSIQGGSNTSIILQVNGDVVGSLTKILVDGAEDSTCRTRAAEILEQMCIHHNQDDECLGKLKEAMTDTMPKVLAQILRFGSRELTEADQIEFPEKEIDIENQCDNPQDNAKGETSSSTHPQNNEDEGEVEAEVAVQGEVEVEMDMEVDELDNEEDEEFHAPLLSLFVTVCDTFIDAGEDLASQFGAIDAFSLPRKLKDMVVEKSIVTVNCLRLMKLTCKMVISMMKHRGSYLKEDMESLTEALSSAYESMYFLDMSMLLASKDDGTATTMKPVRSLASLVKEAKGSVDTYFKAQESGNIEPFTSTDGQP